MRTMMLLFLSLLGGAMCEWEYSKLLFDESINILDYDASQGAEGITHVAFCYDFSASGNGTYGLGYIQLQNETIVSQKIIVTNTACYNVQFSQPNSSEAPVIAFAKQRKPVSGHCDNTNTDACHDVYILDEDWDAVPVSRKNLNDAVDRKQMHIVAGMNGRAYVFYLRNATDGTIPRLAFVTRPSGSSMFGKEELTYYPIDGSILGAVTTTRGSTAVMHVFAQSNGKTLHIFSENSVTWRFREMGSAAEHYTKFIAENNEQMSVIAAILIKDSHQYYKMSWDHGNTWSESNKLDEAPHELSAATIVNKIDYFVLHVLMANATDTNFLNRFVILNTSMSGTDEGPFGDIGGEQVYRLDLLKDENNGKLMAITNVMSEYGGPRTYFTTSNIPAAPLSFADDK